MLVKNNIQLKKYNSFNINAVAKYFIEVKTENELTNIISNFDFYNNRFLIIGNGTNILLANDVFDGLVIKNELKDKLEIEIIDESIVITASSGIDYNVLLTKYFDFLSKNDLNIFSGLENLSQIPTSIGAAIIQNAGAYKIDQIDLLKTCTAYNLLKGKKQIFNLAECKLDYRNSFFKENPHYFITEVQYVIPLTNTSPIISHSDLMNKVLETNIPLTAVNIYNFVAEIRKTKIPSHKYFPNCGSFFKNPVISKTEFDKIETLIPDITHFEVQNGIKVSAAALIENCELKGFKVGDVGISDKHALFIVNYGNATGKEIVEFANLIIDKVKDKYEIELVPEVVIVE